MIVILNFNAQLYRNKNAKLISFMRGYFAQTQRCWLVRVLKFTNCKDWCVELMLLLIMAPLNESATIILLKFKIYHEV